MSAFKTDHEKEHKTHKMVHLEDKNYYCIKHGNTFNSYCIDCNCNICEDCKSSHPSKDDEHQLYEFDKLKPSKEDVNKLPEVVENIERN